VGLKGGDNKDGQRRARPHKKAGEVSRGRFLRVGGTGRVSGKHPATRRKRIWQETAPVKRRSECCCGDGRGLTRRRRSGEGAENTEVLYQRGVGDARLRVPKKRSPHKRGTKNRRASQRRKVLAEDSKGSCPSGSINGQRVDVGRPATPAQKRQLQETGPIKNS